MCNPVAIAGLALAAGGSYMKSRQDQKAAQSAEGAADNILRRDMRHQRGLEDERKVELGEALKRQKRGQQGADSAAIEQELAAKYDNAATSGSGHNSDTGGALTQNAGAGQNVVNDEYRKRISEALGFAQRQGAAKAKLNATNDNNLRLGIANQGNANNIAMLNGIARGDASVAQSQAQRAYQRKMQKVGKFGIGDALQIGGAVMSMGAGSIPGAAAGAAATAAPMVINPYGNMAPASGQVYRSLGPAAPGQY